MPVDAETVFLPISDGVNTARDARSGISVMAAENMVFARQDALVKRNGQDRSAAYGATTPARVSTRNGELVMWGGASGKISRLVPGGSEQIVSADQHYTLAIDSIPVWTRKRVDDVAAGASFTAITAAGSFLRTFDPDTGSLLDSVEWLPAAPDHPAKLVALGDGTVVCYYLGLLGTGFRYRVISGDGTIGSESTFAGNVFLSGSTEGWFDACLVPNAGGDPVVVLFYENTAGDMEAKLLTSGVTVAYTKTIATGGTYYHTCCCFAAPVDDQLVDFVWVEDGSPIAMKAQRYNGVTGGTSTTAGTISSWSSGTYIDDCPRSICGVGGHRTEAQGSTVYATFDTGPARDHLPEVQEVDIRPSGGSLIGTLKWTLTGVISATKPVVFGDGWLFGVLSRAWLISNANATSDPIAAANDAITDQDTFVWVASGVTAPIPCGKSAPGSAYFPLSVDGVTFRTGIPQLSLSGSSVIAALAEEVSGVVDIEAQSVAGSVRESHIIKLRTVISDSAAKVALQSGGSCLLPGSLPLLVDGEDVFELGFLRYPAPIKTDLVAAGSGVDIGTHYYAATVEGQDSRGRLHRSAAAASAFPIEVTAGNRQVNIQVPCVGLATTLRTAGLKLVLWRTLKDETETFYRVASADNSTVAHVYTFNDTATDASIDQNEALHDRGGVLAPKPPASYRAAALWDDRMFVIDDEHASRRLSYSKQRGDDNTAWEFNPDLVVLLDERGGRIVAIEHYGESLVAIKESGSVFVLDGFGLNGLGQGENYRVREVPQGRRCTNPLLVANTPRGLIFDTGRGLHVFSEDQGIVPIEAPRQTYDSVTLTEVVDQPTRQRSVFLASNGSAMVFDWKFGRWSTWTSHASVAGVDIDGTLYRLASDYRIWSENSAYDDDGAYIPSRARLGWIYPGKLGGRGLVKALLPVMYKRGEHELGIKVHYNGSPYAVDDKTYSAASLTAFSEADLHGAGGAGYADQAYTLRFQQSRRSVGSIMVELSDAEDGASGNTAGFELLGMALELAALPGDEHLDRSRHLRG